MKKVLKITITCTCGQTYTITEGNYITCPKCGRPPIFLWNANKLCHKLGSVADRKIKQQGK